MWPWTSPVRRAQLEAEKARLLGLMAENDRRLAELARRDGCEFCSRR